MNKAMHPDEADEGGRIHFSSAGRSLIEEDQIELTSVGVDIGSSTSHLLVSTITLERMDTRYIVTGRDVRFASEILLTPYADGNTIDADALAAFIDAQYAASGLSPDDIDTGALILTGVAARRSNARAIGEIFAAQAGKFVAVSAGDALETLMAAHGSGAVALSERAGSVLNIDVGGGTTKIALCRDGDIVARTALDAGARLIVTDAGNRITRLEPFGAEHLRRIGADLSVGDLLTEEMRRDLAHQLAMTILAAAQGQDATGFMRLPPLAAVLGSEPGVIVFSGGVSEFLDGSGSDTGDLGPELAHALGGLVRAAGLTLAPARQGIRATVVGASQYTVQVSGSTIFLDPDDILPLRNLAVIAPTIELGDEIDTAEVATAIGEALARLDLQDGETAVAVAVPWSGSASYARLQALGHGLVTGLKDVLAHGHPLVIVSEGDIGGLIGMQCRSEEDVPGAIVSIDGIALSEFDFIDIGEVLRSTGATPVVVKSLLFPVE
ncbi:MAG: ethanolamine ammonia-lyase reactivating factor EutA [Jannaschia sp.]